MLLDEKACHARVYRGAQGHVGRRTRMDTTQATDSLQTADRRRQVEIGGGPSFGPEFDDKLDILFGITEADPSERLRVKFEVAVRLLAANYDLEPDNFAELIVLEPGDPVSEERWEQLCNAIMGIAPKHSPAI